MSESPFRPGCFDCTLKHLSQAIAILSSHLSDSEFQRWLAIGHIAEAASEIRAMDQTIYNELIDLITSHVISCEGTVALLLSQAHILINESKLGYPQHVCFAIGYMSQASDIILQVDNEAAEAIRQERLKLMDDFTYIPSLHPFINCVAPVISVQKLLDILDNVVIARNNE